MKKHNLHKEILKDYKKIKSEHLEKLANKMLKQDEMNQKLKEKTINKNIFKLF